MSVAENYSSIPVYKTDIIVEEKVEAVDNPLMADLSNLVVRLRTFMESTSGDVGLGVEMGMQRAADMIENLISEHSEDVRIG